MNAAFFNAVRSSLYGGAISQHEFKMLQAIDQAWEQYGDDDPRKLAYILGTAHHETGKFRWLREIWGPTSAQNRYEGRADLGNNVAGDGKKFMGRGFVHITGRRNYTDWSRRLGLDLIKEPQLAEQPAVAARIIVEGMMLGTFTGKKLGDYFSDNADWKGARAIVNGTDKADQIASYSLKYYAGLTADPMAAPKPKPVVPIQPTTTPTAAERHKWPAWLWIAFFIPIALALAGAFFWKGF
jgi:predicted chitinase